MRIIACIDLIINYKQTYNGVDDNVFSSKRKTSWSILGNIELYRIMLNLYGIYIFLHFQLVKLQFVSYTSRHVSLKEFDTRSYNNNNNNNGLIGSILMKASKLKINKELASTKKIKNQSSTHLQDLVHNHSLIVNSIHKFIYI